MAEMNTQTLYFNEHDPLRHQVVGAPLVRLANQAQKLLAPEPWCKGKKEDVLIDGKSMRLRSRTRTAIRQYDQHWEYGSDTNNPWATPEMQEGVRIYGTLSLHLTETKFYRRRWFREPNTLLSTLDVQLRFPQHTFHRRGDEKLRPDIQAHLRPYSTPIANLQICYNSGLIRAMYENDEDVLALSRSAQSYAQLAKHIGRIGNYVELLTPWLPASTPQ